MKWSAVPHVANTQASARLMRYLEQNYTASTDSRSHAVHACALGTELTGRELARHVSLHEDRDVLASLPATCEAASSRVRPFGPCSWRERDTLSHGRRTEGSADPTTASDQLEWAGRNLLSGRGDTDHAAHTPAAVCTLQSGAHHLDVASAVDCRRHGSRQQLSEMA